MWHPKTTLNASREQPPSLWVGSPIPVGGLPIPAGWAQGMQELQGLHSKGLRRKHKREIKQGPAQGTHSAP